MLESTWSGPVTWTVIISAALTVGGWLILLSMLYVVPHNRDPESSLGWLMFSILLPYVAAFVYAFIGSPKLPDKRRKHQQTVNEFLGETLTKVEADPEFRGVFPSELPERIKPIASLVTRLGEMPVMTGNSVELLPDYEASIKRIAADIDNAHEFVHVLYYIISDDDTGRIAVDAIMRAARRGVRCRVVYDALGSRAYLGHIVKDMREAGVDVCCALPIKLFGKERRRPDLRNHRKIVVVDGKVGYAGSQNLVDAVFKKGVVYEELVVRVEGPVVGQLDAVFLTDYFSESEERPPRDETPEGRGAPALPGEAMCQVLPSGPAFDTDNIALLFATLLYQAKRRAVLVTPYFIPDPSLLRAIENAALRGVDVHLIVSAQGDQFLVSRAQRSYYEEMLASGVKIHAVREPTFVHAKHITIDDDIAVIGSSNFDVRSFLLNLEIVLLVYNSDVVKEQQRIEHTYLERADEIVLDEWLKRPRLQQFVENICRLVSALL